MNYIYYNEENGQILGFYGGDIYDAVPKPNISVTETEWADLIEFAPFRKVDIETLQIIELPIPTPTLTPNWKPLLDSLRGTPTFTKAFGTTNANAWALLLNTLNATHNMQDLQFAIAAIRSGLTEDFTPDEITFINTQLTTYNFPFQLDDHASPQ